MVWRPDGDLAVASANDGVVRVAPNGARTPISASIYAYGLILGPDEMLYAADQSRIHRIDPSTGATEVVLPAGALADGKPRVIAFDLTGERMFVGTYQGSQGRIYVLELDANLDPVGPPTVFARGVGGGTYHDAIGVDICGYLYVPDYDRRNLYRISPDGQTVQTYLEADGLFTSDYGHGLEWGNGLYGWRDDAIYMPMPYNQNKVLEVVIGVPSQHWDGVGVWP
jgi:streptogramin lyase